MRHDPVRSGAHAMTGAAHDARGGKGTTAGNTTHHGDIPPGWLTDRALSDPRGAGGSNVARCGLCYDQHQVWRVTVVVTLPETLPYVLRGEWDRWARTVPHPH